MTPIMKEYVGEALGTFLLVLIGCSNVAVAVVYGWLNLYGVALIFGGGVALAIYASRNLCPAHLNPAVSVAFCVRGDMKWSKLPGYILSQCIGAFLGGLGVYLIFNQAITDYEALHSITRGSDISYRSAVMFGEFFPNPGFEDQLQVGHLLAMTMEALGTGLLMLSILILINIKRLNGNWVPFLIGMTVTLLIIFIAPYTQGGFNPARDFMPRLVAYFGGWQVAAFPKIPFSFFTVYIISPILGALLGLFTHQFFFEKK